MTDPLALIVVFALAAIAVVLGWWCVTISRRIDALDGQIVSVIRELNMIYDRIPIDGKDHPDD